MGAHLQTVHHHEVEMVHVALVGHDLLLHLGQVFLQVILDVVEPRGEKDAGRHQPAEVSAQTGGFGSNLGADPHRSSSFRREDWMVGLVSMHSSKGDNSLFGLYTRREGRPLLLDFEEREDRGMGGMWD